MVKNTFHHTGARNHIQLKVANSTVLSCSTNPATNSETCSHGAYVFRIFEFSNLFDIRLLIQEAKKLVKISWKFKVVVPKLVDGSGEQDI